MLFTIKDIENLSGIKAHTIRIWEQRYSFIKPKRSETNIRYYTNEELKTILNIALLNKYGYKISHIDKMSPESMAENVLSLTDAEAKEYLLINTLLECMVDYDMEKFEALLDNAFSVSGIEKTILKIIFPFLEKVGILWLTNHVNPAQEHLVSNIIRQKIIVGIDTVKMKQKKLMTVCLFLPESEYHELSLLLVFYLMKKKSVNVIYLGAHTPFKELDNVILNKKPDYLYTHITSASQNFNFEKFLSQIHKQFGNYRFIVSGKFTTTYKKAIPPKIIFKKSLAEVKDFIDTLS
ncbi:MAG: MerR family transcriptional regulator [Ginsengibacter sp.]